MWDDRYARDEYVYGTEPNSFLVGQASRLCGPVLSLAEGEGRNAVFLASLGLDLLGVDSSSVGLAKARALAARRGVQIRTEVADLAEFDPGLNRYGAIVSIFAHLPSVIRTRLYPCLTEALLPGGLVVMESYSERQLGYGTGGPKDTDMLMTPDKLRAGFPSLDILLLQEVEREVVEGSFHTGLASVVQFVGRKPL